MKKHEHRLGVSEVTLVVRHLKLQPGTETDMPAAMEEMNQLYGMDDVSYDEQSHVLNLAYDARRLDLDGIEKLLEKHNIIISRGWWSNFKESYYRFVDQNVKDNANFEPQSCLQHPPRDKPHTGDKEDHRIE